MGHISEIENWVEQSGDDLQKTGLSIKDYPRVVKSFPNLTG